MQLYSVHWQTKLDEPKSTLSHSVDENVLLKVSKRKNKSWNDFMVEKDQLSNVFFHQRKDKETKSLWTFVS